VEIQSSEVANRESVPVEEDAKVQSLQLLNRAGIPSCRFAQVQPCPRGAGTGGHGLATVGNPNGVFHAARSGLKNAPAYQGDKYLIWNNLKAFWIRNDYFGIVFATGNS
jgi:hypothetical protein